MNPAPKACCCTCWCAVQRVLAVLCFAEDRDELKYSSAGCKLSVVLLLTIPEAPCLWEKIVKKRDLYFKKKKKTGRFCPDWKSLGTARAGLQQMDINLYLQPQLQRALFHPQHGPPLCYAVGTRSV